MIIWIASYPKSGNTWVRTILSELLYNKKNSEKIFFNKVTENIRQFPSILDFSKNIKFNESVRDHQTKKELINETIKSWTTLQKKINQNKKINFFKTHNILGKFLVNNIEYSFTDLENTLGVIHVVRDPRNIITSLRNHFSIKTEEDAVQMITNKNVWSGLNKKKTIPNFFSSWSNHYNSWKRFPKNNLLIKYENLINNPEHEIERLINYLKSFFDIETDYKRIEKIIELTSFENFKNLENNGEFTENATDENNKEINFFNLGPKNQWQKLIKNESAEIIEKEFKNEMYELKYL